jgi:hypothetical protein
MTGPVMLLLLLPLLLPAPAKHTAAPSTDNIVENIVQVFKLTLVC